jgi:hypothetical protein
VGSLTEGSKRSARRGSPSRLKRHELATGDARVDRVGVKLQRRAIAVRGGRARLLPRRPLTLERSAGSLLKWGQSHLLRDHDERRGPGRLASQATARRVRRSSGNCGCARGSFRLQKSTGGVGLLQTSSEELGDLVRGLVSECESKAETKKRRKPNGGGKTGRSVAGLARTALKDAEDEQGTCRWKALSSSENSPP